LHCAEIALGTVQRCPYNFSFIHHLFLFGDATKKSGYGYAWRTWELGNRRSQYSGVTNGLDDNDAMTLMIMYSFLIIFFLSRGFYDVIVFSAVGKTSCTKDGKLYRKWEAGISKLSRLSGSRFLY